MSKRKRPPSPFDRVLPSVIRMFGPRSRLILTAVGAAALLILFTGSSYILSRVNSQHITPANSPLKKVATSTLPKAQTLSVAAVSQEAQSEPSTVQANGDTALTLNTVDNSQATQSTATAASTSSSTTPQGAAGDQSETESNQKMSGATSSYIKIKTPVGSVSLNVPFGL